MNDLENKSVEALAREVKTEFDKKLDDVKAIAEKAVADGLSKAEKEQGFNQHE